MTTYNRYSVQILAIADEADSSGLQKKITDALSPISKFHVKTVSLDKWVNGLTGEERTFDENGKEITVEGTGLLAKCLCHELDHLDGIVFKGGGVGAVWWRHSSRSPR